MVDSGASAAPGALHIEVRATTDAVHVILRGELDMSTAPQLRAALDQALERDPAELVLDLSRLRFMGSSGIAEACRLESRARERGVRAALAPGGGRVRRVFEVAGLTDLLPFVSPLVDATPPG